MLRVEAPATMPVWVMTVGMRFMSISPWPMISEKFFVHKPATQTI